MTDRRLARRASEAASVDTEDQQLNGLINGYLNHPSLQNGNEAEYGDPAAPRRDESGEAQGSTG